MFKSFRYIISSQIAGSHGKSVGSLVLCVCVFKEISALFSTVAAFTQCVGE